MIRVIISSGSPAWINRQIPQPPSGRNSQITPTNLPIPWRGVRLFLADLIQQGHSDKVDKALAEAADDLALIFPESNGTAIGGAHPDGFLSHNGHIQKPLFGAVTRALQDILGHHQWQLAILDVNALDIESLSVFRALLHNTANFNLFLGTPPAKETDLITQVQQRQIQAHLIHLEAHDFTEYRSETPDTDLAPESPDDPLADSPEMTLWRQFETGGIDPTDAMAICERAFQCFGFHAVVLLGEKLAQTPLSKAQIALLHRLIGIAAYNIQVQSLGDLDLAAFLQHHFERALAYETDNVVKAHLQYRLAINTGRRQGDLEQALAISNHGLDLIRDDHSPRAAFTTAWLLNGRAFVLARLKRLDEALSDCEQALDLLGEDIDFGDLNPEVPMSRAVIIDNLGRLNLYADRPTEGLKWQEKLAGLEQEQVAGLNISFHRWVTFARSEHRLGEARQQAQKGLDHARTNRAPLLEDHYAMELGDLHYRCGSCEEALEMFSTCGDVRNRVGAPAEKLRLAVNLALINARLGRFEQALGGFEAILNQQQDPGARAEILAEAALVEAAAGRYSEERINQAIEAAVECGDQGVLMRVACKAGDISLIIRQPETAVEAYGNAHDIAAGDVPADPSALWLAVVGLAKCTGRPDLLAQTLSLLPAALENAHCWWELNHLARMWRNALTHLPANHQLRREPGLQTGLELLVTAAGQRVDADPEVIKYLKTAVSQA